MAFKPAERKRVFIKIGISAPSGGGKTFGALKLAKGLVTLPDGTVGKIALLDTENESASLYAGIKGIPDFDTDTIRPPFLTSKYIEGINAAAKAGYAALIIDSGSHQWSGEGGILDRMDAEQRANPKVDKFRLWGKYTPEHNQFISAIQQSPIHIILTLRSKQEYAMEKGENGKNRIQKLGAAPVQRDQFEYELSCMFDVSEEHFARVSKDRTHLFEAQQHFQITEETGLKVRDWLLTGAEPAPAPAAPAQEPAKPAPHPLMEKRSKEVGILVNMNPTHWPKGSVQVFCELAYGTPKFWELCDEDYAGLKGFISRCTSSQAKAEILSARAEHERQAKADAQAALDPPAPDSFAAAPSTLAAEELAEPGASG